jgi:hypothetical protein
VREVSGTVLGIDGLPIPGVLVMGVDLNYVETNAAGQFTVNWPEMVLVFWHTGFRPKVRLLDRETMRVDVVLTPQ